MVSKNIVMVNFLKLAHTGLVILNKVIPIKSIGVRVCILKMVDGEMQILLIRHTYKNPQRWYPPGGAVDKNEPVDIAAIREIQEEANITANSVEYITHFLHENYENDYVFLYKTTDFIEQQFQPNYEIAEAKWFPISVLKGDVKNNKSIDIWAPLLKYKDLL